MKDGLSRSAPPVESQTSGENEKEILSTYDNKTTELIV